MKHLPTRLKWFLCVLPLAAATLILWCLSVQEFGAAIGEAAQAGLEGTFLGANRELHSALSNAHFAAFWALAGAGLVCLALLLSLAVLKYIVEGYEARIHRLEEELARREQPVPSLTGPINGRELVTGEPAALRERVTKPCEGERGF